MTVYEYWLYSKGIAFDATYIINHKRYASWLDVPQNVHNGEVLWISHFHYRLHKGVWYANKIEMEVSV